MLVTIQSRKSRTSPHAGPVGCQSFGPKVLARGAPVSFPSMCLSGLFLGFSMITCATMRD